MRMGGWAAALAASLLLTGCSAMLEGERLVVTPHVNQTVVAEDPSILRAENYQGLVNGVLYFVSQGMEEGAIRLSQYDGDPRRDLEEACAEVREKDPLGAYALEEIAHSCSLIISYYECSLRFSYRRTPEQVAALRWASSGSAIREELKQALDTFQPQLGLRIFSHYAAEETVGGLLLEAYQTLGTDAVELPQVQMAFYPSQGTGSQRVVELDFTYTAAPEALAERRQAGRQAVEELAARSYPDQAAAAQGFAQAVLYNPQGKASVYAALQGEGADSLGAAMAVDAACKAYGLTSRIVQGRLNDQTRFWNLVQVDGVYQHLDASGTGLLACDEEMAGYQWKTANYPPCPRRT